MSTTDVTSDDPTTTRVLVVGGGVAAGTVAGALREGGHTGPVVVVTDEPRLPYERPGLSKGVLAGDREPDELAVHDAAAWRGLDVEVRTGCSVVELGTDIGAAVLDDGSEVAWDRAVLATGASAVRPPFDGVDLDGVHVLRTVDHALALRTALAAAGRVVVVGASWIGTEVAAAARGHGCEVALVAPEQVPLATTLGSTVGRVFADLHREHGVELHLGRGVEGITGDARAEGVRLDDGTTLPADLVVLGTGVRPNVGLAERAGLAVDDGVLVDAALRTSDPRVLAIGDVASHDHPRLGRLRVEHVEVARGQATTAAAVLLGREVVHDELPLFWSDQYDLGIEYVGHAGDGDDVVVHGDLDAREFVALWLDDDDVVTAGMHADTWDATEHLRALVGRRVERSRVADGTVALEDLADHHAQDR